MKLTRIALALALAGVSFGANATNGYFSHGYGMKAKGMAGASTTSTEDAFFGANNPAAAAFAGNRLDLGVDLFSPMRETSNKADSTTGPGAWTGTTFKSDSNYFLIPEFGYNHMMSDKLALGVTAYGNGGMNTNYPKKNNVHGFKSNEFFGTGSLGVDLMQLIIAPTAAYKIAPNHSLGISPLLGYQRFEAKGLQAFDNAFYSSSPGNVTNNGHDDSFGYGVRVGYLGKITPTVTIGAAYASKMNFEKLDDYKGLFANQGEFDIPENYNAGVSWQATPAIRLAVDYQRINYSEVDSVGDSASTPAQFGANNGPGFGWDDINVWKLGVEYKYDKAWTLRAGYSHSDNPIQGASFSQCMAGSKNCFEATLNILAPAVIENTATLGFTYTRANGDEVTAAYMHAFENSVTGWDPLLGGDDKIQMYQNSLGIQYSWKM